MRSTDKGVTWSAPITIAELQTVGTVDPETGIGIRDGSVLGAIAAGENGVLAVAWQDSRFTGGAYDGIAFSQSTDGGLTWSAPLRINGNPAVRAFIPSVAIRADGTIGVTYYDFRSNTPDPRRCSTDFWLATSSDGVTGPSGASPGRSIMRRRRSSAAAVPRRLHGNDQRRRLVRRRVRPREHGHQQSARTSCTSLARPIADDTRRDAWSRRSTRASPPDAAMRARIGDAVRDAVRARRRAP